MTPQLRAVPRAVRAIAIAAILLMLLPASSLAADSISLQARALVAGRFEAGGWAAISISLANDSAPVTGYVAADGQDGTVRRLVELPAGSRKEVMLYLRPDSFARTVTVRFESSGGTQLATAGADVRVLERATTQVAVVGDGAGNLRPQLIARASAGLPEPIPMIAADLPDRPEALRGIETIVWAADSATITEAQRRSLERWIGAGGQLVVLGGPDWQARTASVGELLPVEDLASIDDASTEPLAEWVDSGLPQGAETVTIAAGRLRDGAVQLVGGSDGVFFATVTRGAGRVAWIGIDLATTPFRAWPGAALLWSRVVPDDRLISQFSGVGPNEEEIANLMTQALSNLPALEVPPAELVVAVLVGYILLIGPISYLVLRRLDRRDLAWVTTPVLVIVFTAGTWGIGSSMKGSDIIINEVAMVRTTTGATAASVSTFAGLFSPTRATYDLRVEGEALMSGLSTAFVDGGTTATYATEQGTPSRLRGLPVSVFSLQAVRAETIIPYAPSLQVTWSYAPGRIEGTVTNVGDTTIEDVAVVGQSIGAMVGTLDPGESEAFNVSTRNLSGSSASDQVYGFASYDQSTAEQRQILLRRQVIDALVGYGGAVPRGGVATGSIDRGPFVIGWRPEVSPMPIEVDGHSVERHAQSVEILGGRPTLGPGQVAVEPTQMTTTLVSTAGEASASDPSYITIGNGEAVFQVTLPLEMANLRVSAVTLLAGSDPSMVFLNQANFNSMMPAGFRLSVFDTADGEWLDVGDLSQRSRFEVAEPDGVIDHAGRILIRVAGSSVPADFGQVPVFVGASVEGVI